MFSKLSSQEALNLKIGVDNIFILEYLPYAPDTYVKVYLYGLSLASHNLDTDNNVERIAKRLSIEESTVAEAFSYWDKEGLVNFSFNPLSVEYLPVLPVSRQMKKFSKEKYKSFNSQLIAMQPTRNILPAEFNEYYNIMETLHLEPEAMLLIIAYCIRLKGEDISYHYILTVAKNLANEGYLTYEKINERLSEYDENTEDLKCVIKTLGSKKMPDYEDRRLFTKWTKTFRFKMEVIIAVAKSVTKGGVDRLDKLLTKYYENKLFTLSEINDYNDNRDRLYNLTREINKRIGVYYPQLDYIIETYITDWLRLGFDGEALVTIAEYCFKKGYNTLEKMNTAVRKFYEEGLLTVHSIGSYFDEIASHDDKIKQLLSFCKASRPVTAQDRECYKTWKSNWHMSDELIDYAATFAVNKANPVTYISGILASWFDRKITSAEQAKSADNGLSKENTVKKTYTSQQLNEMFDNLNIEDI